MADMNSHNFYPPVVTPMDKPPYCEMDRIERLESILPMITALSSSVKMDESLPDSFYLFSMTSKINILLNIMKSLSDRLIDKDYSGPEMSVHPQTVKLRANLDVIYQDIESMTIRLKTISLGMQTK